LQHKQQGRETDTASISESCFRVPLYEGSLRAQISKINTAVVTYPLAETTAALSAVTSNHWQNVQVGKRLPDILEPYVICFDVADMQHPVVKG